MIYVTGSTGKTEDRSSWTSFIYWKSTTKQHYSCQKKQNTSLVFKDQLILMFQTDNISGSSLPGRSRRYESTFGFDEFGLPSQIDFA